MPQHRCIHDRIGHLAVSAGDRQHDFVPIDDRDLTTIMAMIGDVREIRRFLEGGDDGEGQEAPEDHT
jgi:hypothetical protein